MANLVRNMLIEPETKAILDRIEQVRVTLELNKSRFCQAFGMKPQTYNNFLGKQASRPNVELIRGVCETYRVAPQWVLFGAGEPGEWAVSRDASPIKSPAELIKDNTAKRVALEILAHGNLRAAEELLKAEQEAIAVLRPLLAKTGKGK